MTGRRLRVARSSATSEGRSRLDSFLLEAAGFSFPASDLLSSAADFLLAAALGFGVFADFSPTAAASSDSVPVALDFLVSALGSTSLVAGALSAVSCGLSTVWEVLFPVSDLLVSTTGSGSSALDVLTSALDVLTSALD